MRVDGARDTVRNFDVELGDRVFCTQPTAVNAEHGRGCTKQNAPWYTLASLMSRSAALSTMLRTVKRLIALSLGTHREQLEQRTNATWPRPFLLRPPFLLFFVCKGGGDQRPREVIRANDIASSPPSEPSSSKSYSSEA